VLPPDAGSVGASEEDAEMGGVGASLHSSAAAGSASSVPRHEIVSRDESDIGVAAIVKGWSKVCACEPGALEWLFYRSASASFKSAGCCISQHLALEACHI
jgi:hypothetical protein